MSQSEILKEIMSKVSAIEEEVATLKNKIDKPENITMEQLFDFESRIYSKLDMAI